MGKVKRLGVLMTHPIQYFAPLFRRLAAEPGIDLTVWFAHRPTPQEQGVGFGVPFEWDVDITGGYDHHFLENRAAKPAVDRFSGCDTPGIAAVIRDEKFDSFLVGGWNTRSYWQAMAACWRSGTPVMVRGDSQLPRGAALRSPRHLAKRALYPLFMRRYSACLGVGIRSAEYFRHFGARRVIHSPHFVENDELASAVAEVRVARSVVRSEWGLRPDAIVALFAGKLIPQKRPDHFIRALSLVPAGRVQALVVGDGELRRECESLARQLGADVRFTGFLNQSAMPRAYAAADLLVLPSESETWGLVVNEAMASGLPVIVSDAAGCAPDLIVEGETGYSFSPGDIAALADRIERLSLPGVAEAKGALAARHVSRFSVEAAAAGVIAGMTSLQG